MTERKATIVVVPRERFSVSQQSLESIFARTAAPLDLVYVDGGSPKQVRNYLIAESQRRGFKLIRTEHYLAPNEARNLGFKEVRTPYVVFVDNDVVVTEGWLDALVDCAEATGAWAVGPTYCIGNPKDAIVHHAGGAAHIREIGGQRHFFEKHFFANQPLRDVRRLMERRACEMLEFHVMLVRSDVLRELGPLDEKLQSQGEHLDLCLNIQNNGGTVYHEPASVITYVSPRLLALSDMRFYALRWSEAWNLTSLRHFQLKHHLSDMDSFLPSNLRWLTNHRRMPFRNLVRPIRLIMGRRIAEKAIDQMETWLLRPVREDGRPRYDRNDIPWLSPATR